MSDPIFVEVPPQGSTYWREAVATFADLPTGSVTGESRVVIASDSTYIWNGAAWVTETAVLDSGSVSDTNSVDLTITGGILTADSRLSATVATAGFFKATTTIKGAPSPGLHVEGQIATTSQTGFISSTDWTTFNSKEAAISAGTTDDYWRGDKSFQTLQVSALKPITNGGSASAGKIGEILTASQASATTTGVGATGVYGSVVSLSITAGVWQVYGVVAFSENGANLTDAFIAGISDSATGLTLGAFDVAVHNNLISSTSDLQVPVPNVLISIGSTTTYYLNSKFFYTSGTPKHYGKIYALRIR